MAVSLYFGDKKTINESVSGYMKRQSMSGKKILYTDFIQFGPEENLITAPNITKIKSKFPYKNTPLSDEEKRIALLDNTEAFDLATKKAVCDGFDVLILSGLCDAVSGDVLYETVITDFLSEGNNIEILITGSDASAKIAYYSTETIFFNRISFFE